ncbi:uncharacterized protein LOC107462711 [Arachis duranensis]|uniref:Uncharacterized protein LOC107462711 n=1 Tax=Arachis duranensis TaxID=130453 RepID=A0A6P4B5Y1_ARADU|nr:uncharacterized protein LOC107462711 [Arachis duranensis]
MTKTTTTTMRRRRRRRDNNNGKRGIWELNTLSAQQALMRRKMHPVILIQIRMAAMTRMRMLRKTMFHQKERGQTKMTTKTMTTRMEEKTMKDPLSDRVWSVQHNITMCLTYISQKESINRFMELFLAHLYCHGAATLLGLFY